MNKKSLIDFFIKCKYQRFTHEDFTQYNLNSVNNYGLNALLYALKYNKSYRLDLTVNDFEYLLENSNLQQESLVGDNALLCALNNNASENLCLRAKHFSLLTKEVINKINALEQSSLIDNVLSDLKPDKLSIIWPYIEDKDWFCSYALERNKYLYNLREIKAFIEKKQLEHSVNIEKSVRNNYKI